MCVLRLIDVTGRIGCKEPFNQTIANDFQFGIALVQCLAKNGLALIQVSGHVGILSPLAGEQKHDLALDRFIVPKDQALRIRAIFQSWIFRHGGVNGGTELLLVAGDRKRAASKMFATRLKCKRNIAEVRIKRLIRLVPNIQ